MMVLARNWWAIALRGLLAVIFGLLMFIWPGVSLVVLVLLFGAYALVDGVFELIAALTRAEAAERRWWLAFEGLVGIAAGIVAFVWSGITALALLYVMAAWAIVTGVLEIVTAIRLREVITGEWALIVGGAVSVLFGLLLVLFPGAGALAVLWMIGAYAIVFGVLLIVLAFRLRSRSATLIV